MEIQIATLDEEIRAKGVDLVRLNRVGPLGYQRYLYAIVKELRPRVIVETGVRRGPSTVLMHLAMPSDGILYSCDPCYSSQDEARALVEESTGYSIEDRWCLFPGKSNPGLFWVARQESRWDLFVHDSDHGAENMLFELAFAWSHLREGGVLVCDDWQSCAGAQKHRVFEKFCEALGESFQEIGTAAYVIK